MATLQKKLAGVGALWLAGILLAADAGAAAQAGYVLVATPGVSAVDESGKVRELARRSPVFVGDLLRTSPQGRAQVKFQDGAIVAMRPGSELRVDEFAYKPEAGIEKSLMSLLKGGFRTVSGAIGKTNPDNYRVKTPVATIGIRGTFYEARLGEDGLSTGVWDGGITVCNASGCIDLGQGSDYRFGFVPKNGKPQGSLNPFPGMSDEGDGASGLEGDDGEEGDDPGSRISDLVDEYIQPVFDFGEILPRSSYPMTGFGVASTAAGSNPWGAERMLTLEYARATLDVTSAVVVTDWALWSSSAGQQFLEPSALCGLDTCVAPQPFASLIGRNNDTALVWGSWIGSDLSRSTIDTGFDPLLGGDPVPNAGLFVLGDYASPTVVASTAGKAVFDLMQDGMALPMVQMMNSSGDMFAPGYGIGSLHTDLSSGKAVGSLWFEYDNVANQSYDRWKLLFSGSVSAAGFNLALETDSETPSNASSFYSYDTVSFIALADEVVSGSIDAAFIGNTMVDGLVGAFDLTTASTLGDVQGTFVMGASYPMQGHAYVGNAVANEWGSATDLSITWGFAKLYTAWPSYTQYFASADSFELWVSNAGSGRVLTAYDSCGDGCVPDDPAAALLGINADVRVVWGSWDGSGQVQSSPDFADRTNSVVNDNWGMFMMGDIASPEVIASMMGTVSFMLMSDPDTTYGYEPGLIVMDDSSVAPYYPALGTNPAGSMTVNFDTGAATGNLYYQASDASAWTLLYGGSVSSAGMSLAMTTDSTTPTNGSFYMPTGGGAGAEVAVQGTLSADFVGSPSSGVAGVIGHYDAQTVDSAHQSEGVFVMGAILLY